MNLLVPIVKVSAVLSQQNPGQQVKKRMDAAEEAKKNRGGRPRKYASEGKRPTLTFRVRGKLYEQLQEAAEAGQRSISEEIERSLERYYEQKEDYGELARSVGTAIRAIETAHGRMWHEDEEMRTRTRAAVEAVLDLLVGRRVDEDKISHMSQKVISMAGALVTDRRPFIPTWDVEEVGGEVRAGIIWLEAYTQTLKALFQELKRRAAELGVVPNI